MGAEMPTLVRYLVCDEFHKLCACPRVDLDRSTAVAEVGVSETRGCRAV